MIIYIINLALLSPFAASFSYGKSGVRSSVYDYPSLYEHLSRFILINLTDDFLFYWSHRFLHLTFTYKYIHKVHHEFYNTIAFCCVYVHPVEFLLGNLLPIYSSLFIWGDGLHIVTFGTYAAWALVETHETHSGYQFPINIFTFTPWSTDSYYHNYHHLKNMGNYGGFYRFWDSLFQTNKPYLKEKEEFLRNKKKVN